MRGAGITRGYWNDPAANEVAFTSDGWLRTGDLARIDADGFVFIVDRIKDIIVRGGENIASLEIEAAFLAHPSVIEAAAFGAPHPILGEVPVAAVRLREGATLAELDAFVCARLSPIKRPTRIFATVDPFPRNAAGKVVKGALRERALSGESICGSVSPS